MKIVGKYNTAVCYVNGMDPTTRKQIQGICDDKAIKDARIRIMPDAHTGRGCAVGTTMALKDSVAPSHLGADIGCGVSAVRLSDSTLDLTNLDEVVRSRFCAESNGQNRKLETFPKEMSNLLFDLAFLNNQGEGNRDEVYRYVLKSIGVLGGGNHFIEVDQDSSGQFLLVVHTGFQSLGNYCLEYYNSRAINPKMLERPRRDGAVRPTYKEEEDSKAIKKESSELKIPFGETKGYLVGKDYRDYLHDAEILKDFAFRNRLHILKEIVDNAGLHTDFKVINSPHNYVDLSGETPILRKGAISAKAGEQVIIPLGLKEGVIIGTGLGNTEWNYSAPHGLGRVLSKDRHYKALDLRNATDRGNSETEAKKDNSEAQIAFKSKELWLGQILKETVSDVHHYRTVYNFKALS